MNTDSQPKLTDQLQEIIAASSDYFSTYISLIKTEAKILANNLLFISALAIVSALLIFSTWILCCAALAYLMIINNIMTTGFIILTLILINLAMLIACVTGIASLVNSMSPSTS